MVIINLSKHAIKDPYNFTMSAGAPTIMNLNDTVTVQEGDSLNISCFSYGNPIPTISWYLGDSLAPFSQSDTVENVQAEIVGSNPNIMLDFTIGNITSVLQITNAVYPAHDGEYTCVGLNSNRAGDNTNNVTITVQVQGMGLVACTLFAPIMYVLVAEIVLVF